MPPSTNALRAQWETDHEFATDTFVVVVAKGDNAMRDTLPGKWIRPFGFTNPVLIDESAEAVDVMARRLGHLPGLVVARSVPSR